LHAAGNVVRRFHYDRASLEESHVAADPFVQFKLWLDEAIASESIVEPTAMTLATVDAAGRPSARIVLLRVYDERGFAFFTNYESRKGREIAATGWAALVFWWGALERQVRIRGSVEQLTPSESDAYFMQRPRGHRLGAWASRQGAVVPDRAYLEESMRLREEQFAGREVDRPPYWGGYRVAPDSFEFWQGRRDRMHDRIAYEQEGSGWRIARLSP